MIETSCEDRVLRITLNRPEKRNALNSALCEALVAAFDEGQNDPSVGAILLAANGPAFCGGMDLEEALAVGPDQLGPIHEIVFTQIDRLSKPLIAAIKGSALGGGLGLVANAHIAVASPDARFGLTEIRLGLWPVLVFRAVALAVGERRATEFSLTGRIFTATEALSCGLLCEIASNPLERAFEIARLVAQHSAFALSTGLDYVHSTRGMPWDEAGELGRQVRNSLMAPDTDFEAAAKAFLHK